MGKFFLQIVKLDFLFYIVIYTRQITSDYIFLNKIGTWDKVKIVKIYDKKCMYRKQVLVWFYLFVNNGSTVFSSWKKIWACGI